jgi:branched-subunit amino acid aminotransferase/4-amino-4-deoxychorismate lyase
LHNFVSFNQQISPASEPTFSALSPAALYGKGIFTTIAVYHEKPFLWEDHWRRLRQNAEQVGIDLSDFPERVVDEALAEIIQKNAVESGRARLTFFDERPASIWSYPSQKKTGLLITTADFRVISEINLTISPYRINSLSPLCGVKSCNYLENLLAFEAAGSSGFDEAVRLNERGEISSACLANIFWLADEEIYTPSLETGCLAGTTRELILRRFPVHQVKTNLTALETADGIFLTSAGIGLAQVSLFKERTLKDSDKFFEINSFFRKFSAKNR